MSLSKDLHDKVTEILQNITDFKEVTSGVVPSPSQVRKFPSAAIDFAIITRKKGDVQGMMLAEEEIDIYIYNQQKIDKYDDILSDLVYVVEQALQTDPYLNENCINNYVKEIISDSGILHEQGGRAAARLTLYLKYMERCS